LPKQKCTARSVPFVDAVEQEVHRGGGERAVGRVAGDVGLVDLHAGGGQAGHLGGQHLAERHRQLVEAAVVVVEQRAGQHVGARDGELEGAAGDAGGALAVGQQVERTFAEGAGDDAGGLAAETHRVWRENSSVIERPTTDEMPAIGRMKYSIMPFVSGWLTSKR
jgi:hypothetical protein